ncbi:MAG: hypothetical protein L0210_07105 [Rhodospirillales bacterium]|nr:hypothetical protein [Rhodospirillales bacterium]
MVSAGFVQTEGLRVCVLSSDVGTDGLLLREQEVMQLLQAVELLLQRLNSAERREASS